MHGARPIRPSKGKHFRGKTVLLKNGRMVYWESTLERDCVRMADYDLNVEDIEHQPIHIRFSYRGKPHSYFPDYKLTLTGTRILVVEVKPYKKVDDDLNPVKFEVGTRYCAERGWDYRVYTEADLRPTKYFQRNLKMLRGLGHERTTLAELQYVLDTLTLAGACSIVELRGLCQELNDSEFYKALYKLMYSQVIRTDMLRQKITVFSIVYTE
jgi:hypothetical protein